MVGLLQASILVLLVPCYAEFLDFLRGVQHSIKRFLDLAVPAVITVKTRMYRI